MMRRFLCILLLSFAALHADGQISGDTLEAAEVRAKRNAADIKDAYSSGIRQSEISARTIKLYRQESLADLLMATTTSFVKSTGLNTFSTLSLRGASAAQSAVYWEGVPLMNGATGVVDVSTLPVAMLRSVRVDYGSSASLQGSGNVGGAIMLGDERPLFNRGAKPESEIGLRAGSFGQYGATGRLCLRNGRLFFAASGSVAAAANYFPVEDERGNSFSTENARQRSYNAAATFAWRASGKDVLIVRYWQYSYNRQIPRALFESFSDKLQVDDGFRTMLHWQHKRSKPGNNTYLKVAMLDNAFEYRDDTIGLRSNLQTRQIFAEGGWERSVFRNSHLLLFAPVQYCSLDGVAANPHQYRAAIAGAYSHPFFKQKLAPFNYRLFPSISLRLESFDGRIIALPGFNALYALSPRLNLRANAQYTYRAPTLNELYYDPGGNADLQPEHGWSMDGGYDWTKRLGYENSQTTPVFHQSGSVFNRNIHDWIIWLGGAIWTPHNLAAIHSRGAELENTLEGRRATFFWRVGLNAAYTRSTTTESYLPGDNSIGCQIPYVPLTMLTGAVTIGWKKFYFYWNTMFAGYRYTTSDESQQLPGYSVSNLRATYDRNLKKGGCSLQVALNNIFNAPYAVVAYRPMPGINWSLGATFRLRNSD